MKHNDVSKSETKSGTGSAATKAHRAKMAAMTDEPSIGDRARWIVHDVCVAKPEPGVRRRLRCARHAIHRNL
jgi:hypothetical protein